MFRVKSRILLRCVLAFSKRNMSGFAKDSPPLKPWLDRLKASIKKSRDVRGGNYIQLATVDNNRPRCRTVVFRGFHGEDNLKMITDMRSEKASQISANNACEICYWFNKTSEQYRIDGTIHLVDSSEQNEELQAARVNQWKALRDQAREQFYWDAPGPYPVEDTLGLGPSAAPAVTAPGIPVGGRSCDGTILDPPDAFALMLLHPQRVKYLRLTDNYAQLDVRASERLHEDANLLENPWTMVRMNP